MKTILERLGPLMQADEWAPGSYESESDIDDDDSIEIVPPGQEEEEEDSSDSNEIRLTKEQFEELQKNADTASALKESVNELGKSVNQQQQQPVNEVPQQAKGESDDDFWKRFSDQLFKSDNPKELFQEMMNRMAGPYVNEQRSQLSKVNKQLLMRDEEKGPRFKKYASEIEAFVKSLPAEQQNHPDVWEYAYQQVMQRHQDELIQEEVDRKVKELMESREQEPSSSSSAERQRGGSPASGNQRRGTTGGVGTGSLSPTKKKKRVTLTEQDYRKMHQLGMTERDYAEWKGRNG